MILVPNFKKNIYTKVKKKLFSRNFKFSARSNFLSRYEH